MSSQRIFGIETEYGISAPGQGITAEQAARALFMPVIEYGRSSNVFTENGGRLYLDVGAHPEYATAECSLIDDVVAQDLAGVRMLARLAEQAEERGIRLHLFKNNVDSAGNSFGCHENYLLYRNENFRDLAEALVTFLVTRQIVTGAGGIHDGRWCYSVRAHHMDDAISSATTRTRPIINTRDEPLADGSKYRRMHVIVGDSNISGWTTRLKVAMTTAVLDAYEDSGAFTNWKLADPMAAIVAASFDAQAPLELANGSVTTALEVQRFFLQIARSHMDVSDAQLWNDTLESIATGDRSKIQTKIDWAIKANLLEGVLQRHDVPLTDPIITRTLLAYHDITCHGLGVKMARAGLIEHSVTDEQVEFALTQPPATTRALLRGNSVKLAREYRRDLTVDWNHLRLIGPNQPTIILGDPFATEDERVTQLWAEIKQIDAAPTSELPC